MVRILEPSSIHGMKEAERGNNIVTLFRNRKRLRRQLAEYQKQVEALMAKITPLQNEVNRANFVSFIHRRFPIKVVTHGSYDSYVLLNNNAGWVRLVEPYQPVNESETCIWFRCRDYSGGSNIDTVLTIGVKNKASSESIALDLLLGRKVTYYRKTYEVGWADLTSVPR